MSKYNEVINNINKTIEYLNTKPNFAKFYNEGLGGYSYSEIIISTIGSITDKEEFKNVYIPNLKEKFQKENVDNLSFDESITYFNWLWTAERMAPGSIKVQIEKGNFVNILKQFMAYISENDSDKNKVELRDYVINQIKKSYYKKYENYCITRIYHLLNKDYVKIITQQMFKRNNGIALADLFFPQINLIVEIDESYHEDPIQIEKDKNREKEIINNKIKSQEEVITNELEIKKIKIRDNSLEEINKQIDEIVILINNKINELGTNFIPWTHLYYAPQHFINIGYIDEKMNAGFRTLQEVSELFNKGYHGTQQAYFEAIKGDNSSFVWCPQLKIHETDCDNIPYDNEIDENYIYESSKNDSELFVKKALDSNEIRFVFARYKDEINNRIYKFKGVYKLDRELTNNLKTKRAWIKISDHLDLNKYKNN